MSMESESNPYFEIAALTHRHLHEKVVHLRETLDDIASAKSPKRPHPEVLEELRKFRDELLEHFAQEEEGGYMEEAVSLLPRLGPSARALELQHPPLAAEIHKIVSAAENLRPGVDHWKGVARDFAAFAKTMLTHEAAENALLEQVAGREMRP